MPSTSKTGSTYADGLIGEIAEDGRIHSTLTRQLQQQEGSAVQSRIFRAIPVEWSLEDQCMVFVRKRDM